MLALLADQQTEACLNSSAGCRDAQRLLVFWDLSPEPADPQETAALESQVAAVCACAIRSAFLVRAQVLFRLGEVS